MSVGLLLAVVMAVVLVEAFRRATLKQANSRRNNCLCTWAMCLQVSHDRRWLRQLSEVRATFFAPFDVNDGSWPL